MSDDTGADDPTLPVADPADAPVPPEQSAEHDGTGTETAAPQSRYRQRLADAELERDTLRTRVAALQRTEVERLAASAGVVKPQAVWNALQLADVLTETGEVDTVKAQTAISDAVSHLGLSTGPRLAPDHSQGARGTSTSTTPPDDWARMLRAN